MIHDWFNLGREMRGFAETSMALRSRIDGWLAEHPSGMPDPKVLVAFASLAASMSKIAKYVLAGCRSEQQMSGVEIEWNRRAIVEAGVLEMDEVTLRRLLAVRAKAASERR